MKKMVKWSEFSMIKNGNDLLSTLKGWFSNVVLFVKKTFIIIGAIMAYAIDYLYVANPLTNFVNNQLASLNIKDAQQASQSLLSNEINITAIMATIFFALLAVVLVCGRVWKKEDIKWYMLNHFFIGLSIGINVILIVLYNIDLVVGQNHYEYLSTIIGISIYSALLLLFVICITTIDIKDYFLNNIDSEKSPKVINKKKSS